MLHKVHTLGMFNVVCMITVNSVNTEHVTKLDTTQ